MRRRIDAQPLTHRSSSLSDVDLAYLASHLFIFIFILFFVWGKGGKCVMHRTRRVWDSSAARRWANVPVGQGPT